MEHYLMTPSVVSYIDHAVLQATATDEEVVAACELCSSVGVAAICVKPCHVSLAAERLKGTSVAVSTVIGFPHGGSSTSTKMAETRVACREGAKEVDVVVNLGKALSSDWKYVEAELNAVIAAARERAAITKVIFETGLLPNDELKIRLCEISEACGAAYVKTSTGCGFVRSDDGRWNSTGATEHDVRLMRQHCGPAVGVKASGGIRSLDDARRFIELGATRLGTSSTAQIAAAEKDAAQQKAHAL